MVIQLVFDRDELYAIKEATGHYLRRWPNEEFTPVLQRVFERVSEAAEQTEDGTQRMAPGFAPHVCGLSGLGFKCPACDAFRKQAMDRR